jgi:iron complex transport system substrate-binding protein
MRIVSLLPSATEIVCALGLRDQLVGVSHECDFPPSVRELPKVTRTLVPDAASSREIDALVCERLATRRALYTLDQAALERLQPDLIVTQSLCNVCAVGEADVTAAVCSLPGHPRVVNLEPKRLDDVFAGLRLVGEMAGVAKRAAQVVGLLQDRVAAVVGRAQHAGDCPGVVLLEWIDPPFCAGHWSPELVQLAGGRELIGRASQPSRKIGWVEVVRANPDVLLIACCGFDVQRTHQDLRILAAYPGFDDLACVCSRQVYVVDGSAYFNRPGPRLIDSLEILAHTLHPRVQPLPLELQAAHRYDSLTIRQA